MLKWSVWNKCLSLQCSVTGLYRREDAVLFQLSIMKMWYWILSFHFFRSIKSLYVWASDATVGLYNWNSFSSLVNFCKCNVNSPLGWKRKPLQRRCVCLPVAVAVCWCRLGRGRTVPPVLRHTKPSRGRTESACCSWTPRERWTSPCCPTHLNETQTQHYRWNMAAKSLFDVLTDETFWNIFTLSHCAAVQRRFPVGINNTQLLSVHFSIFKVICVTSIIGKLAKTKRHKNFSDSFLSSVDLFDLFYPTFYFLPHYRMCGGKWLHRDTCFMSPRTGMWVIFMTGILKHKDFFHSATEHPSVDRILLNTSMMKKLKSKIRR